MEAGLLSVLAVAVVTAMVFWMRRAARTLSAQLWGRTGGGGVADPLIADPGTFAEVNVRGGGRAGPCSPKELVASALAV